MDKDLLKDLRRFGHVEYDEKTWVHPWESWWHLYCPRHRDLLIKILGAKYPKYRFYKDECHISGRIYQVINIEKR